MVAPPGQRLTARFEGQVQGVGFRFTVCRLAAGRAVSGQVRNEEDGSVRLVAEGTEPELLGLLRDIQTSALGRYITRTDSNWSAAHGVFKGFDIAY